MKTDLEFRAWDQFNDCFWYSELFPKLSEYFRVMEECDHGGNNVTIQKYSTIKDINNKKVFEGDLVRKSNGKVFLVVFKKGRFMPQKGKVESTFFHENITHFGHEVIGNMFQNPDLVPVIEELKEETIE